MDNRPIGIFDSGLGGLTAVNALAKTLPNESFIYVGDTARVPYGEKDKDTILLYARQIINFLQKKDVKAIIVACGTISSNVLPELRAEFSLPIIDVVMPGVEACLHLQNINRIGVIATDATIKSGFFPRMIKENNPAIEVETCACPLFVPLIEEGWAQHKVCEHVAEAYLLNWQKKPIDALILGCTHYPLLTPILQKVLKNVTLIDMAVATMETAAKFLTENNMLNESGNNCKEFYASGDIDKFNRLGQQITGTDIQAKQVLWD